MLSSVTMVDILLRFLPVPDVGGKPSCRVVGLSVGVGGGHLCGFVLLRPALCRLWHLCGCGVLFWCSVGFCPHACLQHWPPGGVLGAGNKQNWAGWWV